MPVYHIGMFKLKPDADKAGLTAMKNDCEALATKIPGVLSVTVGPPMPPASRTAGYGLAMVVVFDKHESYKAYITHPEHLNVMHFKDELTTESFSYQLEF
ncbi:uncharacterized protein BP5553_10680 [Venustampulla echinocandica]|uniref:Stress-response A/B barrel domain-containing protein n=1 Tax=Venustampulla echinocandica TaxID=2656787 RepID=A0A370T8S1_9HELO|nr:uncharacterized protein BP5553_10680 [Venustampulla echinocandica]RDL29815.1 hypothetical protein BP5553_10680 [Venustampulla echinocandica]